MSIQRPLSRVLALCAMTISLFLAAPAGAQDAAAPAGLRGELIRDVEQLEQKYLALADAMKEHYGYRPGEGVRSMSEVLMHTAGANLMIPSMAGVQPPEAYRSASMDEAMAKLGAMEKETDPAKVRTALQESFAHVRHAIASVSDAQLEDKTNLFGQEATKRRVLTLLVTHLHEHLGQAIAYTRANGVTPPWSE